MHKRNPIIVALDVPTADRALALARQLAPVVGALKVGAELFTSAGPDIICRLRDLGASVFLDLKFHDIPNTVAKAVDTAVRLDVQMLTVHTSGGSAMMEAAEAAARESARSLKREPPLVLGVTVLTSLDDAAISEVGFANPVSQQVQRLALLAGRAGLRGLVCSPLEIRLLRAVLPAEVQLVTPGIRPPGAAQDDQRRTLSPAEALRAGANWLVVGRPIYGSPDPHRAAEELLTGLI
jgi:orotidine-5'-phosphate decarboxylase